MAVRVGVIGTGFMGRTWTEVATNHVEGTPVVAVAGEIAAKKRPKKGSPGKQNQSQNEVADLVRPALRQRFDSIKLAGRAERRHKRNTPIRATRCTDTIPASHRSSMARSMRSSS